MATPHIESKLEDIASIVLMPGDPKRAEYIAKNYLKDIKLVNQVRGMSAYTGDYEGVRVTVFPSGMGSPSMGIYSHELFNFYNVEYIIRIGTMGSYVEDLSVGDVFLATESYSDSSFVRLGEDNSNYLKSSDYLNNIILGIASDCNIEVKTGTIFTSDIFYDDDNYQDISNKYHVMGVEMESYALLREAKRSKKGATTILTVSDSFVNKKELTSEEREKTLDNMIKIALKASLKLKK